MNTKDYFTTGRVNFRPIPSLESIPAFVATDRERVEAILPGLVEDGTRTWQFVRGRNQYGWIDNSLLIEATLPPPNAQRRYVTAEDGLNERSAPIVNPASKVQTLPYGTAFEVDLNQERNGFFMMTNGHWISSNSAWSDTIAPEPTPPIPPRHSGSIFGFNILSDARENTHKLLDVIAQSAQAEKPIPGILLMKMGWGSDLTVADIKSRSPRTKVVVRYYSTEWESRVVWLESSGRFPFGFWNTPDLREEGRAWMREYYNLFVVGSLDTRNADWHQIINEPGVGEGTASFWEGVMDEADRMPVKLALFNFPPGVPRLPFEPGGEIWQSLYPVMRRGLHRGDILSLHEYVSKTAPDDWTEMYELHRHKMVYPHFPTDVQQIPLFLTEYGDERGLRGGIDAYLANLRTAEQMIRGDSYIIAVALWCVGDGANPKWTPDRIDPEITRVGQYLLTPQIG